MLTFVVVAVLGALIVLFIFNRNGLLTIGALRAERNDIQHEIESLEAGVDSLRLEIERLQSDSFYMERLVRETLCWGRPYEFMLRILDETDPGLSSVPGPDSPQDQPPDPESEQQP
jgi:cell division protein FtsB